VNKQDFVCVSLGKMGIAKNAKNVPVTGASAAQFLLRKCCAKKWWFTSKKMWFPRNGEINSTIYGLNLLIIVVFFVYFPNLTST